MKWILYFFLSLLDNLELVPSTTTNLELELELKVGCIVFFRLKNELNCPNTNGFDVINKN